MAGKSTQKKALRRYTDIAALIYLLREQKITLLSPATWDDGNDREFMTLYQGRKRLKSLLALCFSQSDETYHHWRVFSHGSAGVCISFHRERLLQALHAQSGVTVKEVKYRKVREAKKRATPPIRLKTLLSQESNIVMATTCLCWQPAHISSALMKPFVLMQRWA